MPENLTISWKHAEVRCLSGFRANIRPISFRVDRHEIEVRAVLESWREPNYLYFKVDTNDNRLFVLRHHEYEDVWQVREFGRRG